MANESRNKVVQVRFTEAERDAVQRAADREGIPLSTMMRSLMLRAAREAGTMDPPPE